MLKKRIISLVIAVALIAGIVGGGGIVADELGMGVTGQAQASSCGGGSNC